MKKKGFTLVELLAVIVILAIIALIATPIVLGVIENARKGASQSSALGYIDAVEKQIAINMVKNDNSIPTSGVLNIPISGVNIKGQKPTDGWIKLEKGSVKDYSIKIGNYVVGPNEIIKDGNIASKPEGATVISQFSTDSWTTIQSSVKSGIHSYKVGDTKCVSLDGFKSSNNNGCKNGEFLVRVANVSSCTDKKLSETTCGFVVEFLDIITRHNMNETNINVGGWPASSMRGYIKETIFNSLPKELQDVIIDTKVISSHGGTEGETNFESTDKLYLLSPTEIYGTSFTSELDTSKETTKQLEYYNKNGVTEANYSGAIKKLDNNSHYWWLRSSNSSYNGAFFIIQDNGYWLRHQSHVVSGVAPAFRIG